MEEKKISFGFSKVSKKQNLVVSLKDKDVKNVDFIQGFEGNQLKFIG